ncbi:MAG: hypothetical protein GKR90_00905 [Pseudomonadales bacterium]|nr:hypothetical protein [Pseudomonadales bacterium]
MTRVCVLQSFRDIDVPDWVSQCLSSVESWADYHDFEYKYVGDVLLDRVPEWYRAKVGKKIPVVTDLARLKWIHEELESGAADIALWLDADTLIFSPETLRPMLPGTCCFGREYWLQEKPGGKQKIYRNVHNAYCAFRSGCATLPFLISTIEQIVGRVDPDFVAPQLVGPKLLTSLHNTVGFDIDERFGAISPSLARMLVSGIDVSQVLGERDQLIHAANLSNSLVNEIEHQHLVKSLVSFENGL